MGKRRIEIHGQIYYVPWKEGEDPNNPYRRYDRDDVVTALSHLSSRLGTKIMPWEVARKLAWLYGAVSGGGDEAVASWWKFNFPRETTLLNYCYPYNLCFKG